MAGIHSIDRLFPYTAKGRTGTGAQETIAHGLGAVPDFVIVILRDTSGGKTYTLGTHTSTNLLVTVTNGATYDLLVGVKG